MALHYLRQVVAASLVLITLIQIGECVASCDCFFVADSIAITNSDPGCDHDGCPCCSLYVGLRLAAPELPGFVDELLTPQPQVVFPPTIASNVYHPPRP